MDIRILKKLRKQYEWVSIAGGWRVTNRKTGRVEKYEEACLFIYEWVSDNLGFYTFNKQYEKMIKRGRVKFRLF